MRKIKKINLRSLAQDELKRRQTNALLGGKECVCSVTCSTMCACSYTQTLQYSLTAIMAHPSTVSTSQDTGRENAESTLTSMKTLVSLT